MFRFNHVNFNVLDLEKSLAFYKKALGLTVVREKAGENDLGPFRLVYLGDDAGSFTLELTWLAARKEPYDLGEGESPPGLYGIRSGRGATPCTRRWAASALRTRPWASTLSRTRTATGWRSSRKRSNGPEAGRPRGLRRSAALLRHPGGHRAPSGGQSAGIRFGWFPGLGCVQSL